MKQNVQLVSKARSTDTEVRSLMEQGTRTAWRVADLCRSVRDERLWDELGFRNFDEWLLDVTKDELSRSSAYQYMWLIEALPGINIQELEKMRPTAAKLLLHLPDGRRTEERWIKQAQGSIHAMKLAIKETPGALPVEYCTRKYTFVTHEQAKCVDIVVQEMQIRLGPRSSTGSALSAACTELAMAWREEEAGRQKA